MRRGAILRGLWDMELFGRGRACSANGGQGRIRTRSGVLIVANHQAMPAGSSRLQCVELCDAGVGTAGFVERLLLF